MTTAIEEMPIDEHEIDYERVAALQHDRTPWDQQRIATELGVRPVTVGSWRWKSLQYLKADQPVPLSFDVLPLPDHPDRKLRVPVWYAGTIRTWAMQVGRMNPDGTVRQIPRRGRPRKKPTTE